MDVFAPKHKKDDYELQGALVVAIIHFSNELGRLLSPCIGTSLIWIINTRFFSDRRVHRYRSHFKRDPQSVACLLSLCCTHSPSLRALITSLCVCLWLSLQNSVRSALERLTIFYLKLLVLRGLRTSGLEVHFEYGLELKSPNQETT